MICLSNKTPLTDLTLLAATDSDVRGVRKSRPKKPSSLSPRRRSKAHLEGTNLQQALSDKATWYEERMHQAAYLATRLLRNERSLSLDDVDIVSCSSCKRDAMRPIESVKGVSDTF